MASQNKLVLNAIVRQLEECLQDIQSVYPNLIQTDPRFSKVVTYMNALKKSNPRLIIMTWKAKVNEMYKDKILAGDVGFFLHKNYRNDAPEYYTPEAESVINDLRQTIQEMSPANIEKCMQYIQNLCKMAELYAD